MSRLQLHPIIRAALTPLIVSMAIMSIVMMSTANASIAAARFAQGGTGDAEATRQKIATITAFGEHPSRQPRQTTLSEQELNALLADENSGLELPTGVGAPTVAILGPGRVSARAVVDLDAVRKQKPPSSILDPMFYLSGSLPVTATGVLRTSNGVGRFQLESAAVGGVPIPRAALQQIVSFYSRSPERPQGISLDDPFPLPASIREIRVDGGQAIIVQ
jgi:hypothetical protein